MERRDFFRKLGFAAGAIMIAPALLKTEESEGYVIEGDKISEGGREYYHKEVLYIRDINNCFCINDIVMVNGNKYVVTSVDLHETVLCPIIPGRDIIVRDYHEIAKLYGVVEG